MDWDDHAAGWDDQPGVQDYADAAFESLHRLADATGFSPAGPAACDFGCGTGLLTERLAREYRQIDAVDRSPAMLAIVQAKVERHGWDHVRTSTELPGPTPKYDLVVCSSVLGFVDDYPATVAQLVARMKPGGLFVQWDWESNPDDDDDPYGLSRDSIRETLTGAGLALVAVGDGFVVSVGDEQMSPLVGSGRTPS